MKKSVVVSVRIPEEVYDMLCKVAGRRKDKYAEWLRVYGPIGCTNEDISPNGVAKSLLVNAIGKEFAEEMSK